METVSVFYDWHGENPDPYSLGILIEWKPRNQQSLIRIVNNPYSLGILIEWKLKSNHGYRSTTKHKFNPYSLGILIEWKPDLV